MGGIRGVGIVRGDATMAFHLTLTFNFSPAMETIVHFTLEYVPNSDLEAEVTVHGQTLKAPVDDFTV